MKDTFYEPEPDEGPPAISLTTRALLTLAPADAETVMKKCPEDLGKLKIAGALSVGTLAYNTALFMGVGTHLVGHFNGLVAVGGIALAGYVCAADTYFFKSIQTVNGFEQLTQVGRSVGIPRRVRRMHRRSLAIRLGQGILLSAGAGIMASLMIYASDIRKRVELDELRFHAGVVQQLDSQASSDLKRANGAVIATTASLASLNRQINERLARTASASNNTQIKALEARKAAEEQKLGQEKAELASIEGKLRGSMTATLTGGQPLGILTEINALEEIAGEDWKVLLVLVIADLLAMSFDLASVTARTNWLPTRYASLVAEEFLQGFEGPPDGQEPKEPGGPGPRPPSPLPANNNAEPSAAANENRPEPEVKRGRGRPRIHPRANGSAALNLPTDREQE